MFKENYFNHENYNLSFKFGEPVIYAYGPDIHSGNDYNSILNKDQKIKNLIAGKIINFGRETDAGIYVRLKHNFKYMNGVDDIIYSTYKHLSLIEPELKNKYKCDNFFDVGEYIGLMGNTGYCMTKYKDKFRLVTREEQLDRKTSKGVHLHLEFFQIVNKERITRFFQVLNNLNLILEHDNYSYFFDKYKTKIYYNPDIVIKYMEKLKAVQNAR